MFQPVLATPSFDFDGKAEAAETLAAAPLLRPFEAATNCELFAQSLEAQAMSKADRESRRAEQAWPKSSPNQS